MSRMIDADALEKEGWSLCRTFEKDKNTMVYEVKKPSDFPTIEERKTGKWIGVTPMVNTLMCSECEYNIINKEFKTPYCPNCGAKMEGEQP